VCGAGEASLEPIELEASGILRSFATVHVHHGDLKVPFTIGEVQLEAGPLIRATMAPDQTNLAIGQQVSAVWRVARVDAEVVEVVEPMFVAVER
jgi:uncharacterized OB-fold protein